MKLTCSRSQRCIRCKCSRPGTNMHTAHVVVCSSFFVLLLLIAASQHHRMVMMPLMNTRSSCAYTLSSHSLPLIRSLPADQLHRLVNSVFAVIVSPSKGGRCGWARISCPVQACLCPGQHSADAWSCCTQQTLVHSSSRCEMSIFGQKWACTKANMLLRNRNCFLRNYYCGRERT